MPILKNPFRNSVEHDVVDRHYCDNTYVSKLYVVLTVHLITVEIYFTLPTYAQYLTIV
jgi:hypothetical protein